MSNTIDQRVVEMQFDNRHFENNVATTMSSLEKLKQSLNFSGATKGFEDVDSAARKVDMNGLGSAVETVRMKFSALQVMGVTALTNITNSAVNAGKRMLSALTIDPIKTGLSEYETQINAVQTILANTESKGTTLDDVNSALDTLNEYADKTIYNFTEMTRNIGTFTAAGVDLDTSVNAIQGIANLAAVSGSTSQQASTAMYQLSQALSSGTVKLMDWNSVVNAGMGGQVFQDALKETARVHGIAIDDMIKENGSFRETLQEGWLTSEILTETLSKFTMATEGLTEAEIQANREKLKTLGYTDEQIEGIFKLGNTATNAATKVKTFTQLWDTLKETAQSGWTQTWEIIFGDFEEAKSFFSDLYGALAPILEASSNARNELLKGWKDGGGRNDLIESLYNIFDGIKSIVKPIKEAFRDIFPPATAEQLIGITAGLKKLTASLKLSDETSDKLKRTFKGLFAVVDIVRQVISAVFKAITSLFGGMSGLGGGILDITAAIGDWLVRLNEAIKTSDVLNKAMQAISKVFSLTFGIVKKVLGGFKVVFTSIGDAASAMGSGVVGAVDAMGSALEGSSFISVLKSVWNLVKKIGSEIMKTIGTFAGKLADTINNADLDAVLNAANGVVTSGLGLALISLVKGIKDAFSGISGALGGISGILDGLRGCLVAYQTSIKADALMTIAKAIAILAISVLLLSIIDSDKLYDSVVALSLMFAALLGSLAVLSKTSANLKSLKIAAVIMEALSTAVLLLAVAVRLMSDLDFNQLAVGLTGVTVLMGVMVATMKLVGKSGRKGIKHALQLVLFAAAIKVLASACTELARLSWNDLAKGLVGVSVLLAGVTLFLRNAKFNGKALSTSLGVVALAAAIKILASACSDFASMSWEEIGKGLTAVGALLAEVAIFTRLTGDAKKVISTGLAMIAIAAAMKIFASATQDLASMTWGELAKGLVGMAGALAVVVVAMKLLPKNLISSGVGLVVISSALLILAEAFGKMGGMSWSGIAKGLVALGGSLLILAAGLKMMNGSVAGSAALVIASVALGLLAPVLVKLGGMSWGSIAKGLIVLAAAFTVIGVAAALLQPLIPAILGLAGAFALIGAGVALIGVGLIAAGAGLVSIAAGIVALVGALAGSTVTIVNLVTDIITGILKGIANGIVAFCEVITQGLPAIGAALKAIVLLLADILVECIPPLVDAILQFVGKLLEALARNAPRIIDSLFDLIVGILDGLARRLPELIGSLVGIVVSLIQGIIDALSDIKFDISLEEIFNIGALAGIMLAMASLAALFPAAMAGVAAFGVLVAELAIVLAAVGALSKIPGLTWIIGEGGDLLEAIGTTIGRFVGGLVGGVAQGFTSSLPKIASDLSSFMNNLGPFIEGAKLIDRSVTDGVMSLVGVILAITGAELIHSITSWVTGGSAVNKFAKQLPKLGEGLREFTDEVNGINPESVEAAVDAAKALVAMTSTIPNEGGIISWLAGENSVAKFAKQLPKLGDGLKGFSDAVAGISPEHIIASSDAAKVLTEMTSCIPNKGGMAAWFAGDNSVARFGKDIVKLGEGLKGFSDAVTGIVPENVISAANAAKALAEMSNCIPNQGGIVTWFTGDNSIARFGKDIVKLGEGLKGFSDAVTGIVPENVTAAANAAKSLAEMTATIPNQGGIAAWFTGDNSIVCFADDIVKLGGGLKGFSDAVIGIVPENITAAANAAKALAEMTATIPNQGGVVAWFTGDNSIAKFANQIPMLGYGLLGFSNAVSGIVPENVTAAANAAKVLAEMTAVLPNQGGVVAWFTGETSIAKFGSELVALGTGLNNFGKSVVDINPEQVMAGANAAKTLAELTTYIPTEGGVKAWFTGETSVANFADKLPALGKGLSGFSTAIEGINAENVTAAANAAKSLAEMTAIIPTEGGIKAWFTGETSIANFADKLPALGDGLKGFSDSVADIVPENVTSAANAAKSLAEMTTIVPGDTGKLSKFGNNLEKFGEKLKSYFSKTSGITSESVSATTGVIDVVERVSNIQSGNIKSVATSIDDIAKSLKNLSKVPKDSTSEFKKALSELGEASADELVKALEAIEDDTKKAGEGAMSAFVDGVKSMTKKAESACASVATACATAMSNKSSAFKNAGKSLVSGFASGISSNSYTAVAKAKAMAQAAVKAAKEALDINSPSKVFRAIGASVPEGFASGIDKFTGMVKTSSLSMTDAAVGVVSNSIASLADMVNADVDAQPTIRPVLDLSDIKNGARSINGLFGNNSVGVMANVGAISSAMNGMAQNGGNDDVVSAIDKLRKEFGGVRGDSYYFGDISYNDDREIENAVQTLVRAVKIRRRA